MLQHATRQIPPQRIEACISFYALLGFDRVPTPEGIGDRAVWLQRGPTQIHLMPTEGARPQSGHIAVVADDYQAVLRRLGEHGHEVDPRREHWGSPRSFVRDPAGNVVEVMDFPPPGPSRE